MPTIILTRTASTAGESGWYAISDAGTVNFQYAPDATLGGAGVEITQIRISGRARNAASATKQLQIGFRPALTSGRNEWSAAGTALALDAAFAAVPASNGGFVYRTFTRVYDPGSNAAVFDAFSACLRTAFAAGQPAFLGVIQPVPQYETQIDLAAGYWQIAVDYELLGNVPSTDKQAVALGESVTVTLAKTVTGSTTNLKFRIGETVLATQSLGTGATYTFAVPVSAGAYFPATQTAALTIEAETFVGGESYGTVSASVTVTLPEDAVPTPMCSASRVWMESVPDAGKIEAFVQRQSGARFMLGGMAKYGATIATCRVEIEGAAYTTDGLDGVATHLPFNGSGTISYAYSATDSRGLTATTTGSLNVLQWDRPQIAAFTIQRVTAQGAAAVDGTYAMATAQATASPLQITASGGAENKLNYVVEYRKIAGADETEPEWAASDVVYTTQTSIDTDWMLEKNGAPLGGGGTTAAGEDEPFNDMAGYEFRLTVSDLYASASAISEMPTKISHVAMNEKTGSIGFGGEPSAANAPEYDFYGTIRAHGGIEGVTNYAPGETVTGGKWLDGRPIYRFCKVFPRREFPTGGTLDIALGIAPINRMIHMGVLLYSVSADAYLPGSYPSHIDVRNVFSFSVESVGTSPALRLYSGAWMGGTLDVICILEYTKAADAPTYYYLPYLSADSDQECAASASAISGYLHPVYMAFDNDVDSYWATSAEDTQRWIQVQMPYKLKNMVVTLISPSASSGAQAENMPTAGTFQGSNDGSAWTQIGTFTSRSTAAGTVTEHELNNATGYKYLRVQVAQPGAGVWTGFADIRVEGAVETEGET